MAFVLGLGTRVSQSYSYNVTVTFSTSVPMTLETVITLFELLNASARVGSPILQSTALHPVRWTMPKAQSQDIVLSILFMFGLIFGADVCRKTEFRE